MQCLTCGKECKTGRCRSCAKRGKTKDIAGKKYGKLTAIRRTGEMSPGHSSYWECLCDCGKTCVVNMSSLARGHRTSCGCNIHELTGKRFGMLSVINRTANRKEKVAWLCQCDCGQFTETTTSNLVGGKSTSCGCVRTKHLGKGTRLYRIWVGMKDRCLNPNSKYRRRYGGRGITMCPQWVEDFSLFREWALRSGYENPLTIDRIENDQGYCPWNCQWLTRSENSIKGRRDNAVARASA